MLLSGAHHQRHVSRVCMREAPYGEESTYFLAKAQITSLAFAEVPKVPHLPERRGVVDANDPYKVLGAAPGAKWYAVRDACLQLVKAYHPDRFSGVSLPPEVTDYLGAKARSINAAYVTLDESLKSASAQQTGQFASARPATRSTTDTRTVPSRGSPAAVRIKTDQDLHSVSPMNMPHT
jgi:hypothetical protein